MHNILIRLAIAATISTAAIPSITRSSFAADPTLSEILSGKTVPNTVKIRDLTPDWRALATSGQFEFGNTIQMMVSSFTGGAFSPSYYTKGQTISLAGETYMVAYSLQEQPEKITGETTLRLSLLNVKTIGSLNNIRSFNLATETALLEKQSQSTRTIFSPPKMTPNEAPTEVKPAEITPPKPKSKRRRSK
jgi:hypothetical protein